MGAEFKFETFKCVKSYAEAVIQQRIDADYASRRNDHDMYRGDWGSSNVSKIGPDYAANTEKQREAAMDKFLNRASRNEKYIIDYAVVQNLGFAAYSVTLSTNGKRPSGSLRVASKYRTHTRDIPNLSTLKKLMSKGNMFFSEKKRWVGAKVYDEKNNVVGEIELKVERVYKTKPATLPAKYEFLDEYVCVAMAGWCPV